MMFYPAQTRIQQWAHAEASAFQMWTQKLLHSQILIARGETECAIKVLQSVIHAKEKEEFEELKKRPIIIIIILLLLISRNVFQ